jgi:hypothetical protein
MLVEPVHPDVATPGGRFIHATGDNLPSTQYGNVHDDQWDGQIVGYRRLP